MTTQCSGNTIPSHRLQSRAFQLTLNEISRWDALKGYLEGRKMLDFAIACVEKAPTTGHEHIHCYIHFSAPTILAISKTCGAHIEVCRGSPNQNIAYVRKDGDIIWEYGEEPHQGRSIKEVKEMSKEQREDLPVSLKKIVDKINEEEEADMDIDDMYKQVIVFYIYGPSGSGKTEKAKEIVRLNKESFGSKINLVKYYNGFWSGIGTANICIYDDFRDSHLPASEFINFIDYNKHYLNIKGGTKINNYKMIIITSVQDPKDIYKNVVGEPRQQWFRRMEVIEMKADENDDDDSDDDI